MTMKQTSAVDRALRLIDVHGYTGYAAAKRTGIALSTIYRALKRRAELAGDRLPVGEFVAKHARTDSDVVHATPSPPLDDAPQ